MKRTHNNLLLLNFIVTFKDEDSFVYSSFKSLKKRIKRKDMIRIVQAVKSNPRAYSDTGVNYIITEDNASVHSIQWVY